MKHINATQAIPQGRQPATRRGKAVTLSLSLSNSSSLIASGRESIVLLAVHFWTDKCIQANIKPHKPAILSPRKTNRVGIGELLVGGKIGISCQPSTAIGLPQCEICALPVQRCEGEPNLVSFRFISLARQEARFGNEIAYGPR
jgi:hypothetical protein